MRPDSTSNGVHGLDMAARGVRHREGVGALDALGLSVHASVARTMRAIADPKGTASKGAFVASHARVVDDKRDWEREQVHFLVLLVAGALLSSAGCTTSP